jgi:hypothetical protein
LAGSGAVYKDFLKAIRKTEVVFLNAEYDIVIDGSNLINHSDKGVTKLIPSRLIKAIRKVELLGYTPLTCIDRSTYSQAKKQRKPLEGSIEDFAKMIDEEGMRFMNRDDEMIDHALQCGALILTNDRFKKWKDGTEKTKFEIDWTIVDEKLVQWWFEDGFFMPELLKKSSQPSKDTRKITTTRMNQLANSNNNRSLQKKKRSLFIRVLDMLFDNNSKISQPKKVTAVAVPHKPQQTTLKATPSPSNKSQKKRSPQKKSSAKANPQKHNLKAKKTTAKAKSTTVKEKKSQPNAKKSNKPKQDNNKSADIAKFKAKILEILPPEKTRFHYIGVLISRQMESQGIEHNPTTEFLKIYGLPKGLKKAIETHMGEEVIITGKSPKFFVQKKVS